MLISLSAAFLCLVGTLFQLVRKSECLPCCECDDDISEDSLDEMEEDNSSFGTNESYETFDGQASPSVAKSRRNNNRYDRKRITRGSSVSGSSAGSASDYSVSSGSSDGGGEAGVSAFGGFIPWS